MNSYENVLSKKAQSLQPSGIRKFFDILGEMEDVVSLTVGQPDFVTPWHIREAAIDSLEQGKTYYTSNSGTAELRHEISRYLARRFDLHYDANDEILVTVGGSEAIDLAIRACVDDGDEVIVPVPSFVCYGPIVTLAGGTPVCLETKEEDRFKITPEQLRAAITPRTKMLVLPYPNNPTGAIMTRADLEALAEVVREHEIMVVSDEIYSELTYGGKSVSIVALRDSGNTLRDPISGEQVLVVSGSTARRAMGVHEPPVDAAIVGIIDSVEA